MIQDRSWWLSLLVAVSVLVVTLTPNAALAEPPIHESTLARCVPTDARLFLELRDMPGFTATRTGALLSMLFTHMVMKPSPSAQPAQDWRGMIATAAGLEDVETVDTLFSGQVALAADSWSGLGEAVLLATPTDIAAFEKLIADRRVASTADQPVRLYQLASDQELACDGTSIALGHRGTTTSLYVRTVELMGRSSRMALSNMGAFRARTLALSPGVQVLFYNAGSKTNDNNGAEKDGTTESSGWGLIRWPDVESVGVGLILTNDGLILDISSELDEPLPGDTQRDLPIHGFLSLPAYTIAAWTQTIDYADWYRHLTTVASAAGRSLSLIKSLTLGMDEADLNNRLLRRLRGDTICVVGQLSLELETAGSQSRSPTLRLPSISIAVETDAPHLVDDSLRRITNNLLTLINANPLPGEPVHLTETPLPGDIGMIYSVPLARMIPQNVEAGLLDWLQFSWTVADRWVIISTHPTAIDELIRARRNEIDLLPTGAVVQALEHAAQHGGNPQRVLVAQPHLASKSIRAIIGLIAERCPQIRDPEWWNSLQRRHRVSGVQLGIVPTAEGGPGVVVYETLADYPADQRLLPGDRIMAIDGNTLDENKPRESLRDHIADRENPTSIMLTVVRNEQTLDVEIPMPDIPVLTKHVPSLEMLNQIQAILRLFHSASYASWQPKPNVLNARLELHFSELK